jgi:hypothetical protein
MEWFLAGLVILGVGWAAWNFIRNGYLPQPFHHDVGASLMDLYVPAWWANHAGAYDLWRSVYPPLSFDLLRLSSDHRCYGLTVAWARACDGRLSAFLLGVYALDIGLVHATFARRDLATAIPRTIALSFGLPMLYTLDRGNLAIIAFAAFVLGMGGLSRSRTWRWVALAVSINLKPYLAILLFPWAVKRRWPWLVGCSALGLVIYLGSYVASHAGSPRELASDLLAYASTNTASPWSNLYYATSYWPLLRFPPAAMAGVHPPTAVLIVLMRGAQLSVAACVVAACRRPLGIDPSRFAAMLAAVALTTCTNGSAGYAQIFLFLLIFLEPWRGAARIALLTTTYLLCVPFDLVFAPLVRGLAWSYLGSREVAVNFGVSVGQILRPAGLLVIQFCLIAINLEDIVRLTLQDRGQPRIARQGDAHG